MEKLHRWGKEALQVEVDYVGLGVSLAEMISL